MQHPIAMTGQVECRSWWQACVGARKLWATFLTLCLWGSLCLAQTVTIIDRRDTLKDHSWVFFGMDVGPSFLRFSPNNELDKYGVHGNLKALFSHYWSQFVVDAGAGWFVNYLDGESSAILLTNDRVVTWAALLELSGRYRFNHRWELGLQNQMFVGTDTRFATTGGQAKHVTFASGLQGMYVFHTRYPVRLSASVLTDWNVNDRQLFLFLLGVQIGLPINPLVQTVFSRRYQDPIVLVSFDLDAIHFEFDRHVVGPRSTQILQQLGDFLAKEPKSWGMLRIEGHTDNRGTEEYNQKLSEDRANSVRTIIVEQGVDPERVEAMGFGELRPQIPEETELAWAKNRRVELIFDRVKAPEKFKQAIEEIRERIGRPEIFPYTTKPEEQGE